MDNLEMNNKNRILWVKSFILLW